MSSACGRRAIAGTFCEVDLRSGSCCECIRRGRKCNITITLEEWNLLRDKKAKLDHTLEEREDTRVKLVTSRLRLRKMLANLWGERAKAVEKELEAITKDEENLDCTITPASISFKTLSSASAHDLRMSPLAWATMERMPSGFWSPPEARALVDEQFIFERFESA